MSVLCADIAGYSRLVGLDELGTFHRVKALRSGILEPLIAERAGRVIDYAGDGALVVFDRVVDAVECALEIQRRLAEHEPEVSDARPRDLRRGAAQGRRAGAPDRKAVHEDLSGEAAADHRGVHGTCTRRRFLAESASAPAAREGRVMGSSTRVSEPSAASATDDSRRGRRDERGNWAPSKRLEIAPVFTWPPRPADFVRWFFGRYVFSLNLVYAAVAVLFWLFLSPSVETTRTLGAGWIGWLLVRNALAVLLFFGAWHLRLYVTRHQGTAFKYNPRWPKRDSSVFLFGNQTVDNMTWALASGVPIWTAFEVLMLWSYANGLVTPLSPAAHPVGFALLMLAIPAFRDLHFYLTHRLLHARVLYERVHRLHHHNVNPGPWSGLAMHPIEHLLYFSGVLIHFVVPAHPLHMLFQLVHAGLSPAAGHAGFDKVVVDGLGEEHGMDTHAYTHYLHHKHFECNYANGIIPMDKWFGTFHDGSPEAHAAMRLRARQRRRTA